MNRDLRSNCPIAGSLDIFGDRWTLIVLRDILLGGKTRFPEFAADEGIATNVLSERLRRLVDSGLIEKRSDPEDGRVFIYTPLEPAIELIPVMAELVSWGLRNSGVPNDPDFPFAEDSTRASQVNATMASLRDRS